MKAMKSLIVKIVGIISAIILVMIALVSTYTFVTYYDNTLKNIQSFLVRDVEKEANYIYGDVFAKIEVLSESYASVITTYNDFDVSFLEDISKKIVDSRSIIVGGGYWLEYNTIPGKKYYGPYWFRDGQNIKITWEYSNEKNDYTKFDWYLQDGLSAGARTVWSKPYNDAVTQVPMITATSVLQRNGKKIGVVTLDLGLKEMSDYVTSLKIAGLSDYSFSLLSVNGIYLANSDKTLVGKNIKETEKIVMDRNAGLQQSGTNRQRLISFAPISNSGLVLALEVNKGTILAPVYQSLRVNILITLLSLLMAIVVMAFLINSLVIRPIKSTIVMFRKIGEGDLTSVLDAKILARTDEIGGLATAAQEMQAKLHILTSAVRSNAGAVQNGAHEISGAVDEQAASSMQMSASVAEITSTMEELSASSTQIAEHSKSVVGIANQTWENSKKGAQAMNVLLGKMEAIQSDNQVSLLEIVELGSKSKEISKVMSIINVLADQTKLIAFNAALEASSAGESGKRFGVVAAEIRRLADSVTDSTSEIETKINQIQDSISRLVITSEKRAGGIADGMDSTTVASGLLGELVGAASQTSSAAQQISLSTQQQHTASNQVVIALREIVAATQHTAKSLQRIAAIGHEMTGSAQELNNQVEEFKLK